MPTYYNFRMQISSTVGSVSGVVDAIVSGVSHNPASLANIASAINVGLTPPTISAIDMGDAGPDVSVLNFDEFVLYGGSPYDGNYNLAGLPAGFTPLATSVVAGGLNLSGTVQFESAGAGPTTVSGLAYFQLTYPGTPTATDIYTDILTLTQTVSGGVKGDAQNPWMLTWRGLYSIDAQVTSTLDTSSQPIDSTTQITVTSDPGDPDHMKLDQLDQITVTFEDGTGSHEIDIPAADFITATEFLLVFTIPFGVFEPGEVTIIAVGNGTQFSGSITLGILATIWFVNAPGIYKLVSGKTSDTLYVPSNGTTIEVKIPDPFFDTGYIGG